MTLGYILRYMIPFKLFAFLVLIGGLLTTVIILLENPTLIQNEVLRDSIIFGSITGLFGSIIFTLMLWLLKPAFIICKEIAHTTNPKYLHNEGYVYVFKIINNSWLFDVLDVKVILSKVERFPNDPNGEKFNTRHYNLDLIRSDRTYISSRIKSMIFNTGKASYAQLFATEENLHEIFDDNKTLELQIYAKHSLSGFAKIQTRRFKLERCIKPGMFAHGDNFNIL